MRGNSFGKIFSITSFGESHGPAMGVVIDGMPSKIKINIDDLKSELKKRSPGLHPWTTARTEEDIPEIISGVFEGHTLGTPICVIIKNTNQKSSDYEHLKNEFRPGHADETTMMKYGIRDHRGGGRSSGRETVSRVIGGYFAGLILPNLSTYAYIKKLAHFEITHDVTHGTKLDILPFPDSTKTEEIKNYLIDLKTKGESVGGIIHLSIAGVPTALGEPCFDKLKADLAKAILSIGGAIAIEIEDGINGGISNGKNINLEVKFKAPATTGENAKAGRHDPCLLPRVIPVVEAMAKLVLVDHYLRQRAYFN